MRVFSAAVVAGLVAVAGTLVAAAPALAHSTVTPAPATTARAPGSYVPVRPFRAADRTVLAGGVTKVSTSGLGVPSSQVAAVAVTVTTIAPTAPGGLIVYADGTSRPRINNVSYQKSQSVAVAAISRVSSAGVFDVYNSARSGQTRLVVDVSGYYVNGTVSASDPGVLHVLPTPTRAFDTRTGSGAVSAGHTVTAALGGHGGIPSSGVGAVAVAITAVAPTRAGTLTAWAAGNDRPSAASVRFVAGQNNTAFALVPTDAAGRISISNDSTGSVQIAVDVMGWTTAGVTRTPGTFQPRFPARLRAGTSLGANATTTLHPAGFGGVPRAAISAVAVSITVTSPTRTGGLVAWDGGTVPGTTNLQYAAGQSAANIALVRPSNTGTISIRNRSAGSVRLWVDVVGFVPADQLDPPAPSTSHYIRSLQETDSNQVLADKMGPLGQADAQQGSTLVVLEFGVQTITAPRSATDPGVLLTGTSQRLSYAQVVTAVNGYVAGFTSVPSHPAVTIAVGTNNSGAYDNDPNAYPPATRGADWADDVVVPLRGDAPDGVTIRPANDIEASFDGTSDAYAHAKAWEQAYLKAGDAATVGVLIMNGSLDNCPDAFGVTGTTCTSGWTQAGYYALAHGLSPTRIVALPQVYTMSQATQWTNVNATGGGVIKFAGALTEHAACPAPSSGCPTASLPAVDGWAALTRGLQTLNADVGSGTVPAVTDLQIDS